MKFVVSGYTDKISLIKLDKEFNLISIIDQKINSSSFIVLKDVIYCYDREENPYVYMLSKDTLEVVDKIKVNTSNITHLTFSSKNNVLYGCSYSGGIFFGIKIKDNKFDEVIDVIREEKQDILSRCHCVLLNKKEDVLIVVDIATDKLNFYSITPEQITFIKTIKLPSLCGPRHIIYSKNERFIYVITEYSNEIIIVDTTINKVINRYSTLKDQAVKSFGATLFILDDYLYASNRGEESIARFKIISEDHLKYDCSYDVYGKHSRHMIASLDKKHLITCNKNSDNICFIDKNSKKLSFEFSFKSPSCIVQID